MGGGAAKPKLDNANDAGSFYSNLMKGGLPAELRNRLQSQIQGNTKAGEMALRDVYAGRNVSAGAMSDGIGRVRNDITTAGLLGLAEQDFGARLQGAGGRLNQAGLNNQSELSRYQIDKQNEFSWGDAFGSVLGVGGQLGGAAIGKPRPAGGSR